MAIEKFLTKNKLTTEFEESSDLSKTKNRKVYLAAAGIFLATTLFGLVTTGDLTWAAIGAVAAFAIVKLFRSTSSSRDQMVKAGAAGEDIAVAKACELPDQYTLFNQVDIPAEESRTGVREADLVIAGPDCVFVVEIKHNNGHISGEESDRSWTALKTGRGGTDYEKEMRNPVKQVKHQVWLLSQYLKSEKANAWIQPIVLFTNNSVSLDVSGEIPVLTIDEFIDFISTYKNGRTKAVKPATANAIAALKGL